jgi:formate/nitrite transporter FocA (FNT family)
MAQREDMAADVSESEQDEIERRAAVRVVVVHEAIRKEGEAELSRPSSALAWSGFAAGLSMGFSLVGEGLIRSHLPNVSWTPLLAKFGYTLGFVIIILLTYLVGFGQLSHIIAGSVETFYLVGSGQVPFGTFLVSYALPTLLGNIIGGVSIAAALNHAQVVADET